MRLTALLSRFFPLLMLTAGLLLALLPWWRNHDYLRDFYDYGIFIKMNARLDAGQRPWVDVITPAQSAVFLGNSWAEKTFGGTYRGMTHGAAVLIVLSAGVMSLILMQRWRPVWAITLGVAVTVCSASQHTIIFYNPIGVMALAMVTWSIAIAPVLRWESVGWHLLTGAGLILGGMNKINFHLLACGMAVGWMAWAWWSGRAGWGRFLAGLAFVALAGVGIPLVIELSWSGADFRTWFHNIVELPLQVRGGRVTSMLEAKFYLQTVHDYYGTMRIAPAGALILLLAVFAGGVAWRAGKTAGRGRGLFAAGAATMAALGCELLLLTNNEIVYLALAAGLVLTISIWLGFGVEPRGWSFGVVVLAPALVFGAAGWESAWRGQRSQFGHAIDARSDYVDGEKSGPEFAYLRGTKVPPGTAGSLRMAGYWRQELPVDERGAICFGPGLEWLERVWPGKMERGLPLVLMGFDVDRDLVDVQRLLRGPGGFSYLLDAEVWDHPAASVVQILRERFEKEKIGTGIMAYLRLPDDAIGLRTLEHLPELGGNIDPSLVATKMPAHHLQDGRVFRGITGGTGHLDLLAASNRSTAVAVLKRVPGAKHVRQPVRFRVDAVLGVARLERWSAEVVLPEDADELLVPTPQIDGSSLPLSFSVEAPVGVMGGWRELRLFHSVESNKVPPRFALLSETPYFEDQAFAQLLLRGRMPGVELWVRQVRLVDGACVLPRGGEVWLKLTGIYSKIEFRTRPVSGRAEPLNVRALYYKGGRMEVAIPDNDSEPGARRFAIRSSENDGWVGVLNLTDAATSDVIIELISAERPSN